jgi:hypothetical protein
VDLPLHTNLLVHPTLSTRRLADEKRTNLPLLRPKNSEDLALYPIRPNIHLLARPLRSDMPQTPFPPANESSPLVPSPDDPFPSLRQRISTPLASPPSEPLSSSSKGSHRGDVPRAGEKKEKGVHHPLLDFDQLEPWMRSVYTPTQPAGLPFLSRLLSLSFAAIADLSWSVLSSDV